MKRWLLGLLTLLCMVSMVACSKTTPSLEGEWQAQDALKKDYTIVMVTHNMQQATRISDKTAFFLLGEVIEFADTDKLFSMPADKRTEDYITGRFG